MSANAAQPHTFERRILVAVSGMSPQILTETLFKLAVEGAPRFVPTEIHLVSTAHGIELARETLLDHGRGQYFQLLRDYRLDAEPIDFGERNLHVICDADGRPLDDIHDAAANRSAADCIVDLLRGFCSDHTAAVHASMAGGRKTMGFYLGYAMSLLGRPQDRLSHVLLNRPFESCRDFFYPPATPRELTIGGETVNTADARLTLADIPIVLLGNRTALEGLQEGAGYSETVRRLQDSLDEPQLMIDFDAGTVRAHGKRIRMGKVLFSILAWLAIRAREGLPPVQFTGAEAVDTRTLLAVMEDVGASERSLSALHAGTYGVEDFRPNCSKLNSRLKAELGPAAAHYQVVQTGKRPFARYALGLSPAQIQIRGCDHEALVGQITKGVMQ
ncbi:MAG: CRISPR-associated ring nuclease Csm6 [Wenzhouxiangellaceae bacterium]|nr:CRISPR-associated ring nuclease Csm6 [Wenzhouxiangellaceae bacterium]